MKSQKLFYTKLTSPDTQQVIITAQLANINLELNEINKKYDTVNLVTPQGVLNRTNSILRYLTAGTTLNGSTFQQRNQLNTWYEFFNTQLLPVLNEVYAQVSGEKPANEAKYTYCLGEISKNLKVLDDSLKFKTFFVGNNLTLFDITLGCYLDTLFKLIMTEAERKKIVNLVRWYQYVRAIPVFVRHLGNIELCGKDSFKVNFPIQNKEEQKKEEHKKEGQKVEVKSQAKKQQKTQTKTEQKQQKKPQTVQTKLDELKRVIKTTNDQLGTIKSYLQSFEKDKFSIWKIQYNKGQQQGKDLQQTKNLANQNIQKIPNIPKVAFGTWGVYGEQGKYEIQGVMIWKGKEIHPLWKKHPSFDRFKFTQLSPEKEQEKTVIIDYLTESKVAQGLTLQSSQRII